MGKAIIIPGADFSEFGLPLLKNFVIKLAPGGHVRMVLDYHPAPASETVYSKSYGYQLADIAEGEGYVYNLSNNTDESKWFGINIPSGVQITTLRGLLGNIDQNKDDGIQNAYGVEKVIINFPDAISLESTKSMFGFAGVIDISNFNLTNVNISGMFIKSKATGDIDLSHANLGTEKSIQSTFNGSSFRRIIINQNLTITNVSDAFEHCKNLTYIDLSSVKINSGTEHINVFWGTNNLNEIKVTNCNQTTKNFLLMCLAENGSLFKESSGSLVKVNTAGSGWTAVTGSVDTSTMTKYDGTQTASGTYYVEGCTTVYFEKS